MEKETTNIVMTKEEKMHLLRIFLADETYVKAITDTLSPQELDNWLDSNVEQMLIKIEGER